MIDSANMLCCYVYKIKNKYSDVCLLNTKIRLQITTFLFVYRHLMTERGRRRKRREEKGVGILINAEVLNYAHIKRNGRSLVCH